MNAEPPKPVPDFSNVAYGSHARNVLDFWKSRKGSASPLAVYIHGGGFRKGNKEDIRISFLNHALDAGFAVASINYRLSDQACFPAFMLDGGRAIQFLRLKSREWGVDPRRVAATGTSAGAGISLWLGYHEDLADPRAEDPVARESTRLSCIGLSNGQCSYDPDFYQEVGLAPAAEHPFLLPFYGLSSYEELGTPHARKLFRESAGIHLISKGGPPVFMAYDQADVPLPSNATARRIPAEELKNQPAPDPVSQIAIHHPQLGRILKKKLDEMGIENVFHAGIRSRKAEIDGEMVSFFQKQFGRMES